MADVELRARVPPGPTPSPSVPARVPGAHAVHPAVGAGHAGGAATGPVVPTLPSMPTPPAQGAGAWVDFQGGWAMTVPLFVNPVPVPPVPWSSASPPPPQATVFSQASAMPGAIPSPTP